MIFTIDKTSLVRAIASIGDLAPPASVLGSNPVVKLEVKDSVVRFVFGYSNAYLVFKVDADSCSDGVAVADLALLRGVVGSFSKSIEFVEVFTEPNLIKFFGKSKGDKSPFEQERSVPVSDSYVPDLNIPDSAIIPITTSALLYGLKSLSACFNTPALINHFSGVKIDINESNFTLAGTNGVCLTEFTTTVDKTSSTLSCVLDAGFAAKLHRIINRLSGLKVDQLFLSCTEKFLVIQCDFFILCLAVLDVEFPDYSGILSTKGLKFLVNTKTVSENISNLGFIPADADSRVELSVKDCVMTIETPWCKNTGIEVGCDGKDQMRIAFNATILEPAIKAFVAEDVVLIFSKADQPICCESNEGSNKVLSFIAPLR